MKNEYVCRRHQFIIKLSMGSWESLLKDAWKAGLVSLLEILFEKDKISRFKMYVFVVKWVMGNLPVFV